MGSDKIVHVLNNKNNPVHVPIKNKMRDKTKANLSLQLKTETLDKLKQICKDENKSQAKIIEMLIEQWSDPKELPIGSKPGRGIKAGAPPAPIPKQTGKEPTMAELLKQSIKQK